MCLFKENISIKIFSLRIYASEFYYNASDFEAHSELPYNNDDKNYFLLDEYMTYDQLYAYRSNY